MRAYSVMSQKENLLAIFLIICYTCNQENEKSLRSISRTSFCRSDLDTVYYPDKYVIFGHTPTRFLNGQEKIFRLGTLIDIDCGFVFKGGYLGCLCLDTMDEFYV